jgi:hypothetical protein
MVLPEKEVICASRNSSNLRHKKKIIFLSIIVKTSASAYFFGMIVQFD